jgi:hypothetical protein
MPAASCPATPGSSSATATTAATAISRTRCTPGAAHLLRDLRDLYQFEPGKQDWAEQMAGLLIQARDAARAARAEGNKALDPDIVAGLTSHYRSIAEAGLAVSIYRRTATAGDACRIAGGSSSTRT